MPARDTTADRPTVLLLHGLGRTRRAMWPLARAARRRGYPVLNVGYPSRRADVPALAGHVARVVAREAPRGPLLAVTHSLGGIVLRQAVADGGIPAERVARAVMLGPPNGGSELADACWSWPGLRHVAPRLLGPAGAALRTTPDALVQRLPPVAFPLGVIAGTRSVSPLLGWLAPGPHDGKVRVARAGVSGMAALVTVPHAHPFLMAVPSVVALAFAFLETGRFPRA